MGWVLAVSLERATTEDEKVVSTARTLGAQWVHLLEEGACEDR